MENEIKPVEKQETKLDPTDEAKQASDLFGVEGLKPVSPKYEQYKKDGLNTWNKKLAKGDTIRLKDLDGDVTIDGFWKGGQLQDEDTFEEGKDNQWHDFRGIQFKDKDGRTGSINAFQIESHRPNISGNWEWDSVRNDWYDKDKAMYYSELI